MGRSIARRLPALAPRQPERERALFAARCARLELLHRRGRIPAIPEMSGRGARFLGVRRFDQAVSSNAFLSDDPEDLLELACRSVHAPYWADYFDLDATGDPRDDDPRIRVTVDLPGRRGADRRKDRSRTAMMSRAERIVSALDQAGLDPDPLATLERFLMVTRPARGSVTDMFATKAQALRAIAGLADDPWPLVALYDLADEEPAPLEVRVTARMTVEGVEHVFREP